MAVKGKGKMIARKSPATSASSSGKRKKPSADTESSVAGLKKKRSGSSHFIDDAAKDADYVEEEEEEDGDLDWEDFDDFDFELPDIGVKELKNVAKLPVKTSHLPFIVKEEEMDVDELEEAIKERYRGSTFVSFDEDVKESDEPELVVRATKDHSIWRVKCMMGRERQAAFCLMQKFVDLQKIGKKLLICSVFALDHIKGFVYIEADKICNVVDACSGLCILYPSRVELVPRNEAPNLLSIQKKACAISKGAWVRMKNGKYKGDLAEVVALNDTKKSVTIKLVPRIDLQAISKKFGGGTSLKASVIPAPRLISSRELEDFRPQIEVKRDRETGEIFEVLDGLMLKDGYLYKKVAMSSLIHWGVQPSNAELTMFDDTGKNDIKDNILLSSIIKAQARKKLPETSNLKNVDKSNPKEVEKPSNGFDLDDLVLFGRDCGIIIDKENENFKILKGDANGSVVITISFREIKKICIDKVFTAADRQKKTVSIDDVVKVSEGPFEGREGIVKHMYKGFLFIYDECKSENNGFICAKSEMCDLVKKSRVFFTGKSGSRAGPSVAQSPLRSEQEDISQSSSRNRQIKRQGTYSVGQTLRICKGPLKGYLCSVVRIYRSDITVKLDSIGKLLTVDETVLSFPNLKRDDTSAMQFNMVGYQEDPSIGGLTDGGGLELDNTAGLSSFGRDSWNAPSSSSFSFPANHDNKGENDEADPWGSKVSSNRGESEAADPWGIKVSSLNKDQQQEAANGWGTAPSSGTENPWNKMGEEEGANANGAEAWNKTSSKGDTSTDGWQTGQTSATKVSDGWASVANAAVKDTNDVGGWSKSTSGPGESQKLGESGWNITPSKGALIGNSETGGWEKPKLPVSDSGGSWNTKGENDWNKTASDTTTLLSKSEAGGWEKAKLPGSDTGGSWNKNGATAGWNKETSGKDKAEAFGGQSGSWASPKSGGGDHRDSWCAKGNDLLTTNEDNWGNSSAPLEKNTAASSSWKATAASASENLATGWDASALPLDNSTQTSSWDKAKPAPPSSNSGWSSKELVAETNSHQEAGWGVVASAEKPLVDQGGWGVVASSEKPLVASSEKPLVDQGGWGAVASSEKPLVDQGGWGASSSEKSLVDQGGWGAAASSEKPLVDQGGWGAAASSKKPLGDQGGWGAVGQTNSSWDKASTPSSSKEGWKKDVSSGWNKAGSTEVGKDVDGGFGQASRKEWNAGDSNPKNTGWGQGSGWSQGTSNNENSKSWGQGNGSNQRDFDGGRGFSRGRGRGRFGGRGGRNGDDSENAEGSDGGWRSGRGGGRGFGRTGSGGYGRDNSDARDFGRGRGRGRGREQGQGQFESSNWRNKQESFGDGGFSNKNSSSWGGAEGGSWAKPRDEHSAGVTDEKVGWSGSAPGWGTDRGDASKSKNEASDSRNDSWTAKTCNTVSSWNQMSNTKNEGDDAKWDMPDTTSSEAVGWKKSQVKEASPSDGKWANAKEASGSQVGWGNKDVSSGDAADSSNLNNLGSLDQSSNWNKQGGTFGEQSSGWNSGGGNKWNKQGDSFGEQSSGWNSGGGNKWNKQGDSFVEQSSGWNNGGGSKWNKQGDGQDSTENWSSGSDRGRGGGRGRYNSFSGRGSDFGRGGGRGRDGSFSGRRGGRGRDDSYSGGGRGRDDSFSGRGRGRGRNSDGWNRDDGDNRQAFNANQEFKSGGSWGSSSGNSEKGALGSWKSQGENKPGGWANPGSGWATAAAPVSKVECGKSGWDSPTGLGSSAASGLESGSAKAPTTANAAAGPGWADGSGSGSEQKSDPWGTPKGGWGDGNFVKPGPEDATWKGGEKGGTGASGNCVKSESNPNAESTTPWQQSDALPKQTDTEPESIHGRAEGDAWGESSS